MGQWKPICVVVLLHDATSKCLRALAGVLIAKFTDEKYATINQSTAGRFDPRVFVNCLQVTFKQLTKTLGSKRPAVN